MTSFAFAHRGVMLDMARLTERHDYYRSLLPHLADWGFNLLHLHFTDDHGCALRFDSHPELATRHAFTVAEMCDFCAEAGRHGLEVVPEIECFGHAGFITRLRRYRHLNEVDQDSGRFGGMCVFEPEARLILGDLLRETVEIFEPRLVHVGLDEVNFGHHPTSKRLLEARPKNELFADHVNWCHEVVTGLGSRMAMWGDHLLPGRDPDGVIAARTPRDTVIFDWHYEPGHDPGTMDFFTSRGFEVYGAPSVQRAANRIVSSWENFANLRNFSAYALQRRADGVTGMVVTVWCPYRYVAGTIEYPLAIAGRLFASEDLEPEDFAVQFASDFWGLKGTTAERIGRAVEAVYLAAPTREEYDRVIFGRFHNKAFSRADRHVGRELLPMIADAENILTSAASSATRNAGRLRDLAVAAEFLRKFYTFAAEGRDRDPGWRGLRRSMQKAWKRTRYPEGPHYTQKCAATPTEWGDYDGILRHINRLASK